METEDEEWASKEQISKLHQIGISSPSTLALTSLSSLMNLGFDRNEAFELIRRAQQLKIPSLRGTQIIERGQARTSISTGSDSLDNVLGGGVKTGLITDFFGESRTGKTQIAFQLCVNAAIPRDRGGLGMNPLYVDAVGTFRPERVAEMVEAKGFDNEDILEKITVKEVRSVKEQVELPARVKDMIGSRRIGLIVIDTMTETFIQEYMVENKIPPKPSLLTRHVHDLALLALNNDLAVVVTNTVRSDLDSSGDLIETGGIALAQIVHKRIFLMLKGERRFASDINTLPRIREASYRISKRGVTN